MAIFTGLRTSELIALSARAFELRPVVVQALKQQQAASRLKADFVFCNAIGGPLDRDNLMNRVGIRRSREPPSGRGSRTRRATPSPRWPSLRARPKI
ncbi:MAG: hypothetical protein HY294_13705 [Candidatus Rokubacteria bacterium]|nr:hypothetical protein [Candidatus Rokubacteria bacterium]MBI3827043.1 hypothetical protein [Candidatus Rokubacteria bacterium]